MGNPCSGKDSDFWELWGNNYEVHCIVFGAELEEHDHLSNVILDNCPLNCLNIVMGYSMIFFNIGEVVVAKERP